MQNIKQNTQILLNKKAFTLVELIVVITILAILGTIAFITLQGYSSQARDTVRISDINNVEKGLELYALKTGTYPVPSDYTSFTGGTIEIKQGIIGDSVIRNIDISEVILDPLDESYYTYSTNLNGNYYQLEARIENNDFTLNTINTTNATSRYAKVEGNYYFDPSLPSLIVVEDSVDSEEGIFDPNVCFVVDGGENTTLSDSSECIIKKNLTLKDYDTRLVGYWDMETLDGEELKDLSGNENNGIFTGGLDYSTALKDCRLGSCLEFDGDLNHIEVLNSDSLNPESITLQVLVTSYGTGVSSGDFPRVLGKDASRIGGSAEQYAVWFNYNNEYPYLSQFRLDTENNLSGTCNITKNTEVYQYNVNDDIYITLTYDENGTANYYFNGNYFGKVDNCVNGKILETDSSLFIGHSSWNNDWNQGLNRAFYGLIDDVKIYNTVLSASEIKQQAVIAGF